MISHLDVLVFYSCIPRAYNVQAFLKFIQGVSVKPFLVAGPFVWDIELIVCNVLNGFLEACTYPQVILPLNISPHKNKSLKGKVSSPNGLDYATPA